MHATVLAERLREEIEGKGGLPPNQVGFRKGMRTMDNIYVLNYITNRKISKKGGMLVWFFVDLRAAFDSVYRSKLLRALRVREVRKGLVKRCEEVFRESCFRIRVGEELRDEFWMGRGVRVPCESTFI